MTAIITGANAGIGYATALALAQQNITLALVCRTQAKAQQAQQSIIEATANKEVYPFFADLASQQAIRKVGTEISQHPKFEQMDILVNNAGVVYPKFALTEDGIERQFAINHLAYFLLTHLLLPNLQKSPQARIVNVSSDSHYRGKIHFEDVNLGRKYFIGTAYSQSKLANVLFTYELHRLLRERGDITTTVNALHPGVVRTEIGSKNLPKFLGIFWTYFSKFRGISIEDGAKTSVYLATSEAVTGTSAKYFDDCKAKSSSKASYNEKTAKQLWALSLQLTQVEDYFSPVLTPR